MGFFEEIAVLDLTFRVVVASAVLTFIGVAMPIVTAFESKFGFVVGAVAAVGAASLTAKWLS